MTSRAKKRRGPLLFRGESGRMQRARKVAIVTGVSGRGSGTRERAAC